MSEVEDADEVSLPCTPRNVVFSGGADRICSELFDAWFDCSALGKAADGCCIIVGRPCVTLSRSRSAPSCDRFLRKRDMNPFNPGPADAGGEVTLGRLPNSVARAAEVDIVVAGER